MLNQYELKEIEEHLLRAEYDDDAPSMYYKDDVSALLQTIKVLFRALELTGNDYEKLIITAMFQVEECKGYESKSQMRRVELMKRYENE